MVITKYRTDSIMTPMLHLSQSYQVRSSTKHSHHLTITIASIRAFSPYKFTSRPGRPNRHNPTITLRLLTNPTHHSHNLNVTRNRVSRPNPHTPLSITSLSHVTLTFTRNHHRRINILRQHQRRSPQQHQPQHMMLQSRNTRRLKPINIHQYLQRRTTTTRTRTITRRRRISTNSTLNRTRTSRINIILNVSRKLTNLSTTSHLSTITRNHHTLRLRHHTNHIRNHHRFISSTVHTTFRRRHHRPRITNMLNLISRTRTKNHTTTSLILRTKPQPNTRMTILTLPSPRRLLRRIRHLTSHPNTKGQARMTFSVHLYPTVRPRPQRALKGHRSSMQRALIIPGRRIMTQLRQLSRLHLRRRHLTLNTHRHNFSNTSTQSRHRRTQLRLQTIRMTQSPLLRIQYLTSVRGNILHVRRPMSTKAQTRTYRSQLHVRTSNLSFQVAGQRLGRLHEEFSSDSFTTNNGTKRVPFRALRILLHISTKQGTR